MSEKSAPISEIKKNVEYLRSKLKRYQSHGVEPPAILLIELKMAERILRLESIDTIRVTGNGTKHIDVIV